MATVFKGKCKGYNSRYEISISNEECCRCGENALTLSMDGSENEYYNGELCKRCIDALFDRAQK